MDVSAHASLSAKRDVPALAESVKVCMYVCGVVRTDIRVLREARTLSAAGYAVSVVDVESDLDCPVEEDISGIHVRHIIEPHWLIPVHFKLLRLIRTLQKMLCGTFVLMHMPADIYHAHDVSALPACYIAARWHHKPLVFDAHELPLHGLEEQKNWFTVILIWLLAHMISRCTGVITVSAPIEQVIYRSYRAKKVVLVRNIPAYQVISKSDRLRQVLELRSDVRIALYQGNLQPDRGLEQLVRAAKFLEQGIVIVLMGKNVGTTQRQLEVLIAEEGVVDCVKILPPVPYAELLTWTASADIGLILYSPEYSANIQWCLPNKLFEYLMADVPVLATPLDAVASLVETHNVGKVVYSLVPEDVAAAISGMLNDYDTLIGMQNNALAACRQELNWEKESERLVSFYQGIWKKEAK